MEKVSWDSWPRLEDVRAITYICGFCGDKIGSSHGYNHRSNFNVYIRICTGCGFPTLFNKSEQYPGALIGRDIENLPSGVDEVYQEIRNSFKNGEYTGALLLGRKLIMHLAVDLTKSDEGKSFAEYIDDLSKANYIPPNRGSWIKEIKDAGNEKNHQIKIGTFEEAERILKFVEFLLIFAYESQENKKEGG